MSFDDIKKKIRQKKMSTPVNFLNLWLGHQIKSTIHGKIMKPIPKKWNIEGWN